MNAVVSLQEIADALNERREDYDHVILRGKKHRVTQLPVSGPDYNGCTINVWAWNTTHCIIQRGEFIVVPRMDKASVNS